MLLIPIVYGFQEYQIITQEQVDSWNMTGYLYSQKVQILKCEEFDHYQVRDIYVKPFRCLYLVPYGEDYMWIYPLVNFEATVLRQTWLDCLHFYGYPAEQCRVEIYNNVLKPQGRQIIDAIIEDALSHQGYEYVDMSNNLGDDNILD